MDIKYKHQQISFFTALTTIGHFKYDSVGGINKYCSLPDSYPYSTLGLHKVSNKVLFYFFQTLFT